MNIVKDEKWASEIKQRLYDYIKSKRREENGKYHVSDLLFPRFAVLSKIFGYKPTDQEIGFFSNGIAWHEFVQKVLGNQNAEIQGEYKGIVGTADFLDDSVLIEIKTNRKWTVPDEPQPEYIEQLKYYSVIHKRTGGKLLVIYPTAGRKIKGDQASSVEIVAWNVAFSPTELQETKNKMEGLKSLMEQALKSKTPWETPAFDYLPKCPEFKKKSCPYKELCKCGAGKIDNDLFKKRE